MKKTLGKYKIIYNNGITQIKDLIGHDDFENIIVPKSNEIHDLMLVKNESQAKLIKQELYEMFGDDYFTDKSPLYGAFLTGVLSLPKNQGGDTSCKIEKL